MVEQTWQVDLEEFVRVFGSDLFRFEELQAVAAEEDVAKAIHLSSEKASGNFLLYIKLPFNMLPWRLSHHIPRT